MRTTYRRRGVSENILKRPREGPERTRRRLEIRAGHGPDGL